MVLCFLLTDIFSFCWSWWCCCKGSGVWSPKYSRWWQWCTCNVQCSSCREGHGNWSTQTGLNWGKAEQWLQLFGLLSANSWNWVSEILISLALLQALTYRVGHHSTSDDSTKYRPVKEIEWWRLARDPVTRFRKWIESNGWWNGEVESELRNDTRKQVNLKMWSEVTSKITISKN